MMNMYFVISVLPFWQPSNVEETLNVTRDIKLKIILLMQFVEEEERKKNFAKIFQFIIFHEKGRRLSLFYKDELFKIMCTRILVLINEMQFQLSKAL